MTWNVEYDTELGLIHCVYSGRVTVDEFKEATTKAMTLSKIKKTAKFLIDDSMLEIAVSATEIYELPLFYDDIKASRKSKMAVILPSARQARKDVEFYETVCRNRGWAVKIFTERQRAIDWLTLDDPIPSINNN